MKFTITGSPGSDLPEAPQIPIPHAKARNIISSKSVSGPKPGFHSERKDQHVMSNKDVPPSSSEGTQEAQDGIRYRSSNHSSSCSHRHLQDAAQESNSVSPNSDPSGSNRSAPAHSQPLAMPGDDTPLLDDETRSGSYDRRWLRCIEPNELLVAVPKKYNNTFNERIMNDVNKRDTKKYYRAGGGTEILAIAVSHSEAPSVVTRIFIGVWTEERYQKYFRDILHQCELSDLSPPHGGKVDVETILRPNSEPESSSDDDARGVRRGLKKRLKNSLKGKPFFAARNPDGTEEEMDDADEEKTPELFCGQRLFGFRNGPAIFSVTLGGFVSISGIPFMVTSGHLLETPFHSVSEDSDATESDDEGFISGSDSEESSMVGSLPDQEHLRNLIKSREGKLVFRLNQDPKSPIVGIECLNVFADKYFSETVKFSDDWSVIIPSPDAVILGNRFPDATISSQAPMVSISGVVDEADICVNDKIKILGGKYKVNRGAVSSLTVALDLPGGSGFSQAWKLTLERPIEYGESGSWIIDENVWVIGQLTAGIFGDPAAYFIPVTRILDGIREHLPGIDVDILLGNLSQISGLRAEINSVFAKASALDKFCLSRDNLQANPKENTGVRVPTQKNPTLFASEMPSSAADAKAQMQILKPEAPEETGFVRKDEARPNDKDKETISKGGRLFPLSREHYMRQYNARFGDSMEGKSSSRNAVSLKVARQPARSSASYGPTTLHTAAGNRHEAVVKVLLAEGVDPNSKDEYGRTPLSRAAGNGHEAVVKVLLAAGANADLKDEWGRTPLSRAAGKGHEAVVKLLLAAGVDPNSKDEYGRTPLSRAAGNGHEAVVKLLLAAGVDPNSKDEYGRTPLSRAAGKGHEAVVKLLLAVGVDPNSKDEYGRTPLSRAAGNGHEAVVKLLLAAGANADPKDEYGRTPLFRAAGNGHEAVVKLLLAAGANADSKDECGRTPLFWAAENGHEAVVKVLLAEGVDPNSKDECGRTPLFWAAGNGHEAVVKVLLAVEANADLKDEWGRTPLFWAAGKGHEAVVKLLLAEGVDPNSKDECGRTPLSYAAGNGHEAVVKVLLAAGANADPKDDWGRTPLFWAAGKGHEAVVKLLLAAGANADLKDEWGRTPLSYAAGRGYEAVVKLLQPRTYSL